MKDRLELEKLAKSFTEQVNPEESETVEELFLNILKMLYEKPDIHDLNLVKITIKELRRAFKLFAPFRDVRKVCIFGSARTDSEDENYKITEEFSRLITEIGYMVITGAGPGIMEAGNKGAGKEMSFGVNIKLPFEQQPNQYIADSSKLCSFRYFFNRKLTFVKESDATILLPGGFGTHDEAFEMLTLIQTGRSAPRPIIFLNHPNEVYWLKWKAFIEESLLGSNYISPADLSLFKICTSAQEAVDTIQTFYRTYHSIRYFQDSTIIRLNHSLKSEVIDHLNKEFSDLLTGGAFEFHGPEDSALEHAHYHGKYRLILKLNRLYYGRLMELIDFLNKN